MSRTSNVAVLTESKQFVQGRHVDPVETGSDNRGTSNSNVDLFGSTLFVDSAQQDFHCRTADNGVFHQDDSFAFQHFSQRSVFGFGQLHSLLLGILNKRSARVAIADQALY